MKFKIIVPIAVAVLIAVAAYVYLPIKDSLKNSFSVRSSSTVNVSTGSLYQGNTVYGAAMNLAWNDLSETIVHGTIDLSVKILGRRNSLIRSIALPSRSMIWMPQVTISKADMAKARLIRSIASPDRNFRISRSAI